MLSKMVRYWRPYEWPSDVVTLMECHAHRAPRLVTFEDTTKMKRFNKVLPRSSRAGYTLVEVIVAAGIAAFAVASAFAFARYQMTSIRTQTEVTKMNASSALIFQQLRRDLDSAGFGTSFYLISVRYLMKNPLKSLLIRG